MRRLLAPVTAVVRPVWEAVWAEPVRTGRISLVGLRPGVAFLARVGVITLAGLMVSLLFSGLWRRGDLVAIEVEETFRFLPVALVTVTVVVLLIAWLLLMWGAMDASPLFRVSVAALFLIVNAPLGVSGALSAGDRFLLTDGPTLLRVAYFLAPAAVVTGLLVPRLRRRRWLATVVGIGLRTLMAGAVITFFVLLVAMEVAMVEEGFPGTAQQLLSGVFVQTSALFMPLVLVAAIGVMDFGFAVAEGLADGARDLPRTILLFALGALVAVKLVIEVGLGWPELSGYVLDRPGATARTVVSVVLLALLVWFVTREPTDSDHDSARERLSYYGSIALASPLLVVLVVTGTGAFLVAQLRLQELPWLVREFPNDALVRYLPPLLALVAIIVGILWRRRDVESAELGDGLLVLGAWTLVSLGLDRTAREPGFSYALTDVLITLAVAAVLLLRWRRLDLPRLIALTAVVVFSWLALTGGDWVTWVGALFRAPEMLVVVFGLAYTLVSGSGFTAGASPRLPREARVLLFLGYLILSVALLHWDETIHADAPTAITDVGFFHLGVPIGAWLIGRRLIRGRLDRARAA